MTAGFLQFPAATQLLTDSWKVTGDRNGYCFSLFFLQWSFYMSSAPFSPHPPFLLVEALMVRTQQPCFRKAKPWLRLLPARTSGPVTPDMSPRKRKTAILLLALPQTSWRTLGMSLSKNVAKSGQVCARRGFFVVLCFVLVGWFCLLLVLFLKKTWFHKTSPIFQCTFSQKFQPAKITVYPSWEIPSQV